MVGGGKVRPPSVSMGGNCGGYRGWSVVLSGMIAKSMLHQNPWLPKIELGGHDSLLLRDYRRRQSLYLYDAFDRAGPALVELPAA